MDVQRPNVTWPIALSEIIRLSKQNEDAFQKIKEKIIGRTEDSVNITLETVIDLAAAVEKFDYTKFKKSIDLGGGDQEKLKKNNLAWKPNLTNFTLITAGHDDDRLANITTINQKLNEDNKNGQENKNVLGHLTIEAETRLTAISAYDYINLEQEKLGDTESLLIVPVGSTDAHIIVVKKESIELYNCANFNEDPNPEQLKTIISGLTTEENTITSILFAGTMGYCTDENITSGDYKIGSDSYEKFLTKMTQGLDPPKKKSTRDFLTKLLFADEATYTKYNECKILISNNTLTQTNIKNLIDVYTKIFAATYTPTGAALVVTPPSAAALEEPEVAKTNEGANGSTGAPAANEGTNGANGAGANDRDQSKDTQSKGKREFRKQEAKV